MDRNETRKKGLMVEIDSKVRRACQLYWGAEGYLTMRAAMFLAGYSDEECKDRTLEQRCRRSLERVIPKELLEANPIQQQKFSGGKQPVGSEISQWMSKFKDLHGSDQPAVQRKSRTRKNTRNQKAPPIRQATDTPVSTV